MAKGFISGPSRRLGGHSGSRLSIQLHEHTRFPPARLSFPLDIRSVTSFPGLAFSHFIARSFVVLLISYDDIGFICLYHD